MALTTKVGNYYDNNDWPSEVLDALKDKGLESQDLHTYGIQKDETGITKSLFVILAYTHEDVLPIFEKSQFKSPLYLKRGNFFLLKSLYIEKDFKDFDPVITEMLTDYGLPSDGLVVFTLLNETSPYISNFSLLNFKHRGIRYKNDNSDENLLLMIYGEASMDEIKFGIEFEVCVCDNFEEGKLRSMLKSPFNTQNLLDINHLGRLQGKIDNFKIYTLMLRILNNEYNLTNDFIARKYGEYYDVSPEELYTSYFATSDSSIECAEPLNLSTNRTYKKKETFTAENCDLVPIELVTPIISLEKPSFDNFISTLDNIILNENFLYESNDSQGMHINVSHPEAITILGKEKFLKLWWHFEPLIFTFIPSKRRESGYAKALRKVFPTLSELEATWKSVYSDPDDDLGKYNAISVKSNRFEVRIVPSGMSREHILNWLKLCIKLVYASVTKPCFIPEDEKRINLKKLISSLFDDYLEDEDLKAYFSGLAYSYINPLPEKYKEFIVGYNFGYNYPQRDEISGRLAYKLALLTPYDYDEYDEDDKKYLKQYIRDYLGNVKKITDVREFLLNDKELSIIKSYLPNVNWSESFSGVKLRYTKLVMVLDNFPEFRNIDFVISHIYYDDEYTFYRVMELKTLFSRYPWLIDPKFLTRRLELDQDNVTEKSELDFLKSLIRKYLDEFPPDNFFILKLAVLADDYDTVKKYYDYNGEELLIKRFYPINNIKSLAVFKLILPIDLQILDTDFDLNVDEAEDLFEIIVPKLDPNQIGISNEFFRFFNKFFQKYNGPCSNFIIKYMTFQNTYNLERIFTQIMKGNDPLTPCQLLLYKTADFSPKFKELIKSVRNVE
jgi:hypothetical protein